MASPTPNSTIGRAARPSMLFGSGATTKRPTLVVTPGLPDAIAREAEALRLEEAKKSRLHEIATRHWATLRAATLALNDGGEEKDRSEVSEHGLFRYPQPLQPTAGFTIDTVVYNSTHHHLWVQDFTAACRYYGPVLKPIVNMSEHDVANPFQQECDRVKLSTRQCVQLVYLPKLDRFLGYSNDESELRLYDTSLQLVSKIPTPIPPSYAALNPDTGDVVVCFVGSVCTYTIRRGSIFTLKQELRDKIPNDQAVSFIDFEKAVAGHQRMFLVCGHNVLIFHVSGSYLGAIMNAHPRPLTCVLFIEHFDVLLTTGRDGAIKAWDASWQLIHIFHGHSREVTALKRHPSDSLAISTSIDQTIRFWNLVTLDCVFVHNAGSPLLGLDFLGTPNRIYTHSPESVSVWDITMVHFDFSIIGNPVTKVRYVKGISTPERIVALSEDSSVRLISPATGTIITSVPALQRDSYAAHAPSVLSTLAKMAEPDARVQVVDVAFSSLTDKVYCLLKDGTIKVYSASTNPCSEVAVWPAAPPHQQTLSLCLAEFSFQENLSHADPTATKWSNLVNRIVAGTRVVTMLSTTLDGCIERWDIDLGRRIFRVPTQGSGRIIHLGFLPESMQLVSVSDSTAIQAWSLSLAHSSQAISPVSVFTAQRPPTLAALMSHRVCVAYTDHIMNRSILQIFDTNGGICYTHHTDLDHETVIQSLEACPKLRLFASATKEGVIKFWDEQNHLLKTILLHEDLMSLAFFNDHADVALGIQGHLHVLHSKDLLPLRFFRRIMTLPPLDTNGEEPIPISESSAFVDFLGTEDDAAKYAVARREQLRKAITEEISRTIEERHTKEYHELLLAQRDRDIASLMSLRDDVKKEAVSFDNLHEDTPCRKDNAFYKYLLDVYPANPEVEEIKQTYQERALAQEKPIDPKILKAQYDSMPESHTGPSALLEHQILTAIRPGNSEPSIAPDGFIPNSVIWQKLIKYGANMKANEPPPRFIPPSLNEDQLKLARPVTADDDGPSLLDLAMATFEDDEEEEEATDDDGEDDKKKRKKKASSKGNFRPLSPREMPEKEERLPTPPLVSKPRTPTPPKPRTPTPPPPLKPDTPPRKVRIRRRPVLPKFIANFRGEEWFENYFPRALPETFDFLRDPGDEEDDEMPQISLEAFLDFLASNQPVNMRGQSRRESKDSMGRRISMTEIPKRGLIHSASIRDAVGIAKALQVIAKECDISEKQRHDLAQSMLSLLHEQRVMEGDVEDRKLFIEAAAGTIAALKYGTAEAVQELMENFIISDEDVQVSITRAFETLGLEDPKGVLATELKKIRRKTLETGEKAVLPSIHKVTLTMPENKALEASKHVRTFFNTHKAKLRVASQSNLQPNLPVNPTGIDVLNFFVKSQIEEIVETPKTPPPPPKLRRPFVPDRRTESDGTLGSSLPRLGYISRNFEVSPARRNGILSPSLFGKSKNMLLLPMPKYGLDVEGQFSIPTLPPLGRGSSQKMFNLAGTWMPSEPSQEGSSS